MYLQHNTRRVPRITPELLNRFRRRFNALPRFLSDHPEIAQEAQGMVGLDDETDELLRQHS